MARPFSGSVRWNKTAKTWTCRVTLIDGTRSKPIAMTGLPPCVVSPNHPPKGCKCAPCTVAVTSAALVSKRMRDGGAVEITASETTDDWFARYEKYSREIGQTDVTAKASRWRKWISPRIGAKPIIRVSRDDIEDIRDALDASILAWAKHGRAVDRISGKTAMNVWSALTSSFKAAASSKRRDLRVLVDLPNPCVGVEPPGDRDSRKARRKRFVYPKEAATVFACDDIPLQWREVHAIAAFTYLRPGELRVLTFADIDCASGLIHVTKAWNYEAEEDKAPKTRNGVRRIPIEASLLPLLERMSKDKDGAALVVPIMSDVADNALGEIFREHLSLAGITRSELHVSTTTHALSNFRTWRDSGITWLAMSGLGVDKIMRRAGHDDVNTTMGYVKQAEDLTGDLGVPFAPLPHTLIDGSVSDATWRHGEVHYSMILSGYGGEQGIRNHARVHNTRIVEQHDQPVKIDSVAIVESTSQSTKVNDDSTSVAPHTDPDEALRVAIKLALDAGDFERVKALVSVLESSPKPVVVDIATRRAKR